MTSTLVSHCVGFRESFHLRDILNQPLSPASIDQQLDELLTQAKESSVAESLGLPASTIFPAVNPIIRPPITRRHSSSTFSSVSKSSSQLPPCPENIPLVGSIVGGALESLPEERFRSRAYSEGSAALNIDSVQELAAQQQSVTSRYKTELCRQFEESGKCKYGDKCQFAHGKAELRHMVRHPKYKTELCRTYHTSGICPYGPRCHFIHNPDEPNVGVQKQISVPANPVPRPSGDRPMKLQLGQQGRIASGYSYSPPLKSPLEANAFLFGASEALVSPRSPIEKIKSNHFFNFTRAPMSPVLNSTVGVEKRRASPPLTKFEFPPSFSDLSMHDDRVFSGSLTPPDSDRESSTGSPPGFGVATASSGPNQQRLPIFRCLSQSDQKGV